MAAFTVARPSDTKFKVIIEGGPELAAKLNMLDAKIKRDISKAAITNAGRLIADIWADVVPIGSPPHDPHPGAYQRAMRDSKAVTVRGTANGASGTVRPAVVPELADDQQPRIYAAVLEFGDESRDAQPSARPAFEASLPEAIRLISESIRIGVGG